MSDLEQQLAAIAKTDVDQLLRKEAEYGGSWKKRGGIGAMMMASRKWDRLEQAVQKHGWDIFAAAAADMRKEGLLDDIGDLRCYLMLIENEIRANQLHVGNGLFREGDEGYYAGLKVKIMTVYQDGNVDLEYLATGVRANGVKWQYVTKETPHVDNTGQKHPFGYQCFKENE